MIYFIYHGYVAKVRIICDIIVNALRFLSLMDGFCDGGGVLTQISTDGVVRFMTDFLGFAVGVSLTDFADGFSYRSQISQISQIFLSHRFRGFCNLSWIQFTQ